MDAATFSEKWIDLDEEVPNFNNDPAIPVMVKGSNGELMTVKSLEIERHDPVGYTVWIGVEDF